MSAYIMALPPEIAVYMHEISWYVRANIFWSLTADSLTRLSALLIKDLTKFGSDLHETSTSVGLNKFKVSTLYLQYRRV